MTIRIKKPRNRPFIASILLCWHFLLVSLAACSGAAGQAGAPVVPVLTVRQSPEEVVNAFMGAWNSRDYQTMYSLISVQSQGQYPLNVFESRYQQVADTINISAITYDVGEATLQGTTAAVTYDVNIESPGFETIPDPGRIMRLVDEGNTWRVAWSTMDILDGLSDTARLDVDSSRPPRGSIYDRNGLPLVEQGNVVAIYVQQQLMPDIEICLDLLARLTRIYRPTLAQLFAINNIDTIFYVTELDGQLFAQFSGELETTCGLVTEYTAERITRRYDYGGSAVHVTGYTGQIPVAELQSYLNRGYVESDLVGLSGVEAAYDAQLNGLPTRVLRIREPGGAIIRELGSVTGSSSTSVTLTLDRGLQRAAAQALADAYNYSVPNWAQFSPGGAAVVLDVNTGAVLALASYPGFDPYVFDPNSFNPDRPGALTALTSSSFRQPLFNYATQGQYAPGSTFKIITTAATAAENLIAPNELFSCELEWDGRQFGDTREVRYDWRYVDELPAAGEITITQALAASCNPFFYQHGALLYSDVGPNTLFEYARQMGLGAQVGLSPLLPEAPGQLQPITSPEAALMSAVGQFEVQVTLVQMAYMVAGIANGGTLYRPYIVQRVGGTDGTPVTFEATPTPVGSNGLSQEVLNIVQTGMCLVVSDEDLGTAYGVLGAAPYRVCGKTGTAQSGQSQPHAWFVAYAPADDPQIAVAVMVLNSREGSEVAAPIARRILETYFNAPYSDFPEWWPTEYIPINLPEGSTGG